MIKHLKRFVAITISLVMAFQFSTNDLYTYAQTEDVVEPTQTEVSTESDSTATEQPVEPSETVEGAADTTTPPETGTTPETQPAESQQEVAGTLKVEFVDASNATVKESVEQSLTSKYVGDTIRLEDLSIETNVEGYTLTEVKDKNDNTQVYTTETKDFVLTGNVTELQFVYTQNVQTDQQNGMEDEKKESSKLDSSPSINSILLANSGEQIPVTIVGVDNQEQATINPGRIDSNTLTFEGYIFSHAETASGNRLNYAGILDGAIYYSLVESDDDYYQPATPLGNDNILLVYKKIGYPITLTISTDGQDGNTVEGNNVDCPTETINGESFSINVSTARGYNVELKLNGQIIKGENGVYTINPDMIKPDESGQVFVHVDFNKQKTYQYWVSDKANIHWHDASWSNIGEPNNPSTFNSGENFTFTVSTTDGHTLHESPLRLNSFQINNYDINVPISYSEGSRAETILPSGTKVIVECIEAPGWKRPLYYEYNYTYSITVENAMENIVVTYGNFRYEDHKELMILKVEGVDLQYSIDGKSWESIGSSTPIAYPDSNNVHFRYSILPGYEMPSVYLENNDGSIINQSYDNNYYYFDVVRGRENANFLNVVSDPAIYSLIYDKGEVSNVEGLPSDDNLYSISRAENTKDNIYISNNIPTSQGKVFNGWKIGEIDILPGQTIHLNKILDEVTDNQIVVKAQWVDEEEESDVYMYSINLFMENEQGEYDKIEEATENQYATKGQEITIINAPDGNDKLSIDFSGYEINELSNRTLTINGPGQSINFYYSYIDYQINYENVENAEMQNPTTYRIIDEISLNSPTKEGFVFMGWTGNGIQTPTKNITIKKGSTGNKSFVAHWEKDENNNGEPDVEETKYMIRYESEDEDTVSGMPKDVENVLKDTKQTVSTVVPVRKGYIFEEWTSEDVDVTDGEFTMPAKNVTFTASWTKDDNEDGIPDKYQTTVTFKVQNGTFDQGSKEAISMKVDLYGEDGNWSENGQATLKVSDFPSTYADKGYEKGSWDVESDTVVITKTGKREFTYTFALKSSTLTVERYTEEGRMIDTETQTLNYGEEYTVKNDETVEYEGKTYALVDNTQKKITGKMPDGNKTIRVYYALSEDGDTTPDKYQTTVTFKAINGHFENNSTSQSIVVELKDSNGNWSENGSYTLNEQDIIVPVANEGYVNGQWDINPNGQVVTATTKNEFTMTFQEDSNGNGQPDVDESYDITVNYVFAEGEESDDVTLPSQYILKDQAVGYEYSVTSPTVTGYIAVPTIVSGTVDDTDVLETVEYYKDANGDGQPDVDETKYTIHYVSGTEDTVNGMPGNVTDVLKDTEQIVSTVVPVRSGYIFTGWTTKDVTVAEGRFIMPSKDVTFTATWTLDEDGNGTPDDQEALVTFNVVNGTFEDGSTSRSMKFNLDTVLTEADVPTVVASSGYAGGNWNTTINGFIVRENVVFTYTFDRINVPVDPTDPGDGTDDPTTPTTPDGGGTTTPTTPTTPGARTTDDGTTTDEPEVEEIEDEETPLSDGEVEEVEENATPKSNNSVWALINLIAAIVTVILGLFLLLSKRHRNGEDEDEDERQARMARGDEKEQEQKRGWICKVLGVVVAIVSVVFFILTQDMSLPMALTDKWTIWMIVITIIELVLVLVGTRWKDVKDDEK